MNFKQTLFIILSLIVFSICSNPSFCNSYDQILEGKGEAEKGVSLGDKIKLIKGENRLKASDNKSAYNLVYAVYQKNDKNPKVNYLLGQCLLASEDFKEAAKHLEIASQSSSSLSPKTHYYLGIAYHRSGQIDKALAEFDKYITLVTPAKAKSDEVETYIAQCNLAKEQMMHPQQVKIVNLGGGVNSKYPDYSPSVTADGKTLIFTSRRPDTKGKKMDENDFMFYEDIYMSRWNDTTHNWSMASNNIEGLLNTQFHDANLSITANGKQILIYRNVPGQTKSGDIYYSDLGNSGKWSEPKAFGPTINSTYFESSACLTPDGKTLYFVSERKGGFGRGDIYVSHKTSSDWSEAENIGNIINTVGDEISLFLHPDGKTLYFSSDSHNGIGGYDIFKTTNENGKWSVPVNVGYPINTVGDDLSFTITSDDVAYYVSDHENGLGAEDIYQVQFLKEKAVPEVKKEMPVVNEMKEKIATETVLKKEEIPVAEKTMPEQKTTIVAQQEIKSQVESVPVVEKKKRVVASNVNLFETKYILFAAKNSDIKLTDQQEGELNAMIDYLITNPSAKIQVSANENGDSYQRVLAQNRSWNIADYFRQNGLEYSHVLITANDKGSNRVAVKIVK